MTTLRPEEEDNLVDDDALTRGDGSGITVASQYRSPPLDYAVMTTPQDTNQELQALRNGPTSL